MEKTLGSRIGALRRAKGLKQDELAEQLGVSPQAVSKWENEEPTSIQVLSAHVQNALAVEVKL